ncbi:asparaginase [Nucisporomicrobium flavum]|uniref:asparaginase n=1 Tax=Nucisporomicrobium flavum TaxID=2785915 RepID=UPI0018F7A068|nr:asparaginase [Nucisporomicrobium flavum]
MVGAMATIVVCGLGGTIAMTAVDGGAVAPALTAASLVRAVPGLAGLGAGLEVVDVANVPSSSLRLADLAGLSATIAGRLAAGADGVVVTTGTDTLEECAYLLDLLHDGPQPVVVTGAMRSPALAGADGPANLLAAVSVATSPGSRGRGVLVAFADEVHAAVRVRKGHSTRVTAFESPVGGPVGYVVEGVPHFVAAPAARFVVPRGGELPRVPVVVAALGEDAPDVPADAAGLVVAAFGVGHLPQWWAPPLAEAARRVPVVLATRTLAGPVLSGPYGYPGSERDLLERGLIPAGLLGPWKARILLMAALAAGAGREQVAAAFAAAGGLGDAARWPWPVRGGART